MRLAFPTTRSLAVVTTGEQVFREEVLPGAVLTRVAASHVRVGTFQYFAARGDQDAVRELLDYVIARHYPDARDADVPALAVLKAVAERQAALIADWMRVGFIHGVMNTDNMAISGETIDYGPCAFMDQVPSEHGVQLHRPRWALRVCEPACDRAVEPGATRGDAAAAHRCRLGQSGRVSRLEVVQPFIAQFDAQFPRAHAPQDRSRVSGGRRRRPHQASVRNDAGGEADFTLTFRRLALGCREPRHSDSRPARAVSPEASGIDELAAGLARSASRSDPQTAAERAASMRRVNPAFIPRNHRVEAALNAASESGDLKPFHRLLGILQRPYDDQPEVAEYEQPPQPSERVFRTFCGT